jgi:HlyD family secretion protein
MSSKMRGVLIVAGVVALLVVLRVTLFRPHPLAVEVATAERGLVEDAVTNSQAGTVKSRLRARVGAERAGRVSAIPHREGSAVRRGVTMLELDPTSARMQLDLAERDRDAIRAARESARATATLARQDHERTRQLLARQLVSQELMDQTTSRLDGAEAELHAAEARFERANAAVRLARDELDLLRVVAPFDGVVTQRFVEVGESVVPGEAVLELMSPDSLYVSAPIDEIDIGRLRQGLPARVTLDPHPGFTWRGTLTRVSPFVNDVKEQNRTLEVEVDLVREPGLPRPKPGTSADVFIVLDRRERALRVPTFAIAEGRRVLIVRGGRAVAREVRTGLKNWEWTEITSGLEEGDAVITNLDKQGLKPGVAVSLPPRARGPTGSGTAEAGARPDLRPR